MHEILVSRAWTTTTTVHVWHDDDDDAGRNALNKGLLLACRYTITTHHHYYDYYYLHRVAWASVLGPVFGWTSMRRCSTQHTHSDSDWQSHSHRKCTALVNGKIVGGFWRRRLHGNRDDWMVRVRKSIEVWCDAFWGWHGIWSVHMRYVYYQQHHRQWWRQLQ